MKKIYILSTIWMAFIVGACDYNDNLMTPSGVPKVMAWMIS